MLQWQPKKLLQEMEQPGDYQVRIVDAVEGASQKSGAKMVTVAFETMGEPSFRLWDHFVDHAVSRRRMVTLLAALQLLEKEQVEVKDLVGKTLRVRVAIEKFQGLPSPRVKRYLPADGEEADQNVDESETR